MLQTQKNSPWCRNCALRQIYLLQTYQDQPYPICTWLCEDLQAGDKPGQKFYLIHKIVHLDTICKNTDLIVVYNTDGMERRYGQSAGKGVKFRGNFHKKEASQIFWFCKSIPNSGGKTLIIANPKCEGSTTSSVVTFSAYYVS